MKNETLQKLGISGMLGAALLWMHGEVEREREAHAETRKDFELYVEMTVRNLMDLVGQMD